MYAYFATFIISFKDRQNSNQIERIHYSFHNISTAARFKIETITLAPGAVSYKARRCKNLQRQEWPSAF
jgi:hypothetical protein